MEPTRKKRKVPPFIFLFAIVLLAALGFVARKAILDPPIVSDRSAPSRSPMKMKLMAKRAEAEATAPKADDATMTVTSNAGAPKAKPKEEKDAGPPPAPPEEKKEFDPETMKAFKALLEKVGAEEKKDVFTEDPVDYAVAGPDGGVPIHEGTWKSPFAHPKYGTPANIKVGMLLANVRNYDIQHGTFEADFFLTLTSDKHMPPMDLIFTNGKMDAKEEMANKPTFKMYRFLGTFSSPADLHLYPFDTQELVIEVEDDDNGIDQIHLIPDEEHTNLDIGFDVPGWETAYIQARINTHNFPDRMENDDLYYARYQFVLGLRRFATSAVFTVFVPALVIVLISLTGLWITRDELEVRSNATTPMLAAAVLFHYALIQSLPATAYLTRADKLMLSVYVILGLHMFGSLLWFFFDEKHTDVIFKWVRIVGIPLTFAILAGGMAG